MKWLDKLKEKGLDLIEPRWSHVNVVLEPDEVNVHGLEEFSYCDDDIYITFHATYIQRDGMMVQLYQDLIPMTTIHAIKKGIFVI